MRENLNQDISILSQFDQTTLEEMDRVKLMNRTDTKFVFKRSDLPDFLTALRSEYKVLNVEGNLISSYKTLYFDTPKFDFFLDHHNGRGNRFKVRIRNYVESGLFFLEIKNKFKDRTDKNRIRVEGFEMALTERSKNYISQITNDEIPLESKLWNGFQRITLVNKHEKERLTLDLGLNFDWNKKETAFDHIVIGELKQEKVNRSSTFYELMKSHGVRPNGISKYCVGSVALYPDLKYNNFKEKLRLIDKLL